jgi:hypothetical protein
MKSKESPLRRINRILDYNASRGITKESANRIKHKIIFAKYGKIQNT